MNGVFFEKRKTSGWYDRTRWEMKDRCEWKDVNDSGGMQGLGRMENRKGNVDPGLSYIKNGKGRV